MKQLTKTEAYKVGNWVKEANSSYVSCVFNHEGKTKKAFLHPTLVLKTEDVEPLIKLAVEFAEDFNG